MINKVSILKKFLPSILNPKNLREVYNYIFYKNKTKHVFEYENEPYKRQAFINKAISKFRNCKYLEIGVDKNQVFNSIPLSVNDKFGVDPISGGNMRMTSDDFFKEFKHLKFDVIFIDGLHEYEQCKKDCINSLNQLNDGGIIFFHDFLPRSEFEEKVPRQQISWTGDVWKVAVELNNCDNAEFKIINIDNGIGILKIKKNFSYKEIPNIKNLKFKNFIELKKTLPIINSEEALNFIMQ